MKKLLIIGSALAVLGITSLTSCKKDRTCTCTVTDSSSPFTSSSSTTINGTKKDAEAECNSETTVGALTTTCELE